MMDMITIVPNFAFFQDNGINIVLVSQGDEKTTLYEMDYYNNEEQFIHYFSSIWHTNREKTLKSLNRLRNRHDNTVPFPILSDGACLVVPKLMTTIMTIDD